MIVNISERHLRYAAFLLAWSMISSPVEAQSSAEQARIAALRFDRALLCRVEGAYLERQRHGLPGFPEKLFSVSRRGIVAVAHDERRQPVLAAYGLSPATYLTALSAIIYFLYIDLWQGEKAHYPRLAATEAFLDANKTEIEAVFGDAGEMSHAGLPHDRENVVATEVTRRCPAARVGLGGAGNAPTADTAATAPSR